MEETRWRKILYVKQPFEDNYVDHTFLNELVKNANFTAYSLSDVMKDSAVIIQQISVVTLFVLLFVFTLYSSFSLPLLLSFPSLLLIIGFSVRAGVGSSFSERNLLNSLKSLVLIFCTLFALSPVLKTLTEPFSEDTIIACTLFLLFSHLVFHDYSFVNGYADSFSAPISLNAAIFASVLLASRLNSTLHVFSLISVSIEVFALSPILFHHIKKYSEICYYWLTVTLALLSVLLLLLISVTLAVVFTAVALFITIACPIFLIFVQKYKNEIHGPWDEAIPIGINQPL